MTCVDRLPAVDRWGGCPSTGSGRRHRAAAGPVGSSGPGPSTSGHPRAGRSASRRCRRCPVPGGLEVRLRRGRWPRRCGGWPCAGPDSSSRDVDVTGPVVMAAGPGQRRVERLGLDAGPREAVEDRALDGVGSARAGPGRSGRSCRQGRTGLAPIYRPASRPSLVPSAHRGPKEEVARSDVRYTVQGPREDDGRLGSLARSPGVRRAARRRSSARPDLGSLVDATLRVNG